MAPDSLQVAEFFHRHALILGVGAQHFAILGMQRPRHQHAPLAGSAHGHHGGLGTAVEPSYMEALATSMPVSWQIMVWNSKMVVSVPCEISA
jgi:hypothetical protein